MSKHTSGPWEAGRNPVGLHSNEIVVRPAGEFPHGAWIADCGYDDEQMANAILIAAAPTMADAIKGFIGLCQLLRNRDDCPTEIRQALTHNHRLIAGYEALSAAGIEGFQPSDFDAHKTGEVA